MNAIHQSLSQSAMEPPSIAITAAMAVAPAGPLQPAQRNQVRLMDLLDMLIQRAYHDLILLAEVDLAYSARKTDMDRKLEIMQYLSRTRNFFMRFLALLKWSSNMTKVDKCFHIINTLEEQSALFVETADVLARLSRETLSNSKLPCYQVSFAVDVLNSRTCPRLPACIKDKIIAPEALTEEETAETVWELENALMYRLVTSDRPPLPMRHFTVGNGRVVFRVEGEFSVAMAVMGDDKSMPFFILDIDILVEHRRVGDGKPLVHAQQINYVKQLIQTRIMDCEQPLDEVYNILHNFCQSLKLEVLYSQVSKYMVNTGIDYYRIELYKPSHSLTLAYWEDNTKKIPGTPSHTVTIALPADDDPSPDFVVQHTPPLLTKVPLRQLDIQECLMGVIHTRVKERLRRVEKEVGRYLACRSEGLPCRVAVEMGHAVVWIGINYYTGFFNVRVDCLKDSVYVRRVEDYLNSTAVWKVDRLVGLLREVYLDVVMTVVRGLAHNAMILEHPRLLPQASEVFRRYEQLGPHSALFRFQKKIETTALLAISAHLDPTVPDHVRIDYHVLLVEPQGLVLRVAGMMSREQMEQDLARETPKSVPEVKKLNPFDVLKQRLAVMKAVRSGAVKFDGGKRFCPRALEGMEGIIVDMAEMSMFGDLRAVLKEKGWAVLGVRRGAGNVGLEMRLRPAEAEIRGVSWRRMARLNVTSTSCWFVDVALTGVPFQKNEDVMHTTLAYESSVQAENVVDSFGYEYHAMVSLLRIMQRFHKFVQSRPASLENWDYDVEYTVKMVKISYGVNRELMMVLAWSGGTRRLLLEFGTRSGNSYNPHRHLQARLGELLNRGDVRNVHRVQFARVVELVALTTPLVVGARAVMRPVGLNMSRFPRHLPPQSQFQLVPLSLAHYVACWKSTYGILIHIQPGRRPLVKDLGVLGGPWQSTPHLKALVEHGDVTHIKTEPGLPILPPLDADVQQSMERFFASLRASQPQVVEGPGRILLRAGQ